MMAGGGGSAVAGGPALRIPVLGRPAATCSNLDRAAYISMAPSARAATPARFSPRPIVK